MFNCIRSCRKIPTENASLKPQMCQMKRTFIKAHLHQKKIDPGNVEKAVQTAWFCPCKWSMLCRSGHVFLRFWYLKGACVYTHHKLNLKCRSGPPLTWSLRLKSTVKLLLTYLPNRVLKEIFCWTVHKFVGNCFFSLSIIFSIKFIV